MNAEPHFFDQIDDFLAGKLTPADHAKMEDAISAHADLAKAVSLRRLEFEVAESLIAADIRAQFSRLRQQPSGETPPPDTGIKKWAIPVVLFLLFLAVVIWSISFFADQKAPDPALSVPPKTQDVQVSPDSLNPDKTPDTMPAQQPPQPIKPMASAHSKRLAMAQEAYVRPDFGQVRGSASALDSFEVLIDAWQKNDYKSVQTAAAKIKNTSPLFIKSRYILAHAQFLSRNYGQAATVFGQVADSGMMPYSEEAEWYVILALMSQKTVDQAVIQKRIDRILNAPDHTYFDACKSLNEKR